MFINILITLLASTAIAVVFRQLDKKNRNFEKVARLYKQIKSEFTELAEEKYRALKDFDNCLDVSMNKGDSMIHEIKRTLDELEERYACVTDEKERVNGYYTKLDEIGVVIEKVAASVAEISTSEEFVKTVEGKLVDFRKELALVERDLNRIEDNFKKENTIAIKEVSKKAEREAAAELGKVRESAAEVASHIDAKCNDVLEQLENHGKAYEEKLASLDQQGQAIAEAVNDKVEHFAEDLETQLNAATAKHETKLERYQNTFAGFEGKLLLAIQQERSKSLTELKNEAVSLQNRSKEDFLAAEEGIINRIETLFYDKNVDAERLFAELKVIEERISNQMLSVGTMSSDFDNKIAEVGTLLDAMAEDRLKKMYTEIDAVSADIDTMESGILAGFKEKYNRFSALVDQELAQINTVIENKIEATLKNTDGLSSEVTDLHISVERLQNDMKERSAELGALVVGLKNDAVSRISAARMFVESEITDLKNLYENEKSELLDKLSLSFDSTNTEAEKKLDDIKVKIESIYNGFTDKLGILDRTLAEKTEVVESKFDEKLVLLERGLDDREAYINAAIKEKLDQYDREASAKKQEFLAAVDENREHIEVICRTFDDKLKSVEDNFDTTMQQCRSKGDAAETAYEERLKDMEEQFRLLNDRTIKENSLKLCSFEDQFTQIENKLQDFDGKIAEEISSKGNYITEKTAALLAIVEEANNALEKDLAEQRSRVMNETDELMQGYRAELADMKENTQRIHSLYEERLSEKYEEVDRELLGRMRDINELTERIKDLSSRYMEKLTEFDDTKTHMEEDITQKLGEIEDAYRVKADDLVADSKLYIESIEKKYELLNERIDDIHHGFATDIEGKILQAKSEIDTIVTNGAAKINGEIDLLNGEIIQKFEYYKTEIASAKEMYARLEEGFIAQYNRFIGDKTTETDTRVAAVMEQHEQALEVIKENIQTLEHDFQGRMDELERYYKEKVGGAVEEKITFIMHAEERLKRLDDALADNELRMDSEIDNKLENARKLIDAFFDSSQNDLFGKYKNLEEETAKSIDVYKNDLLRIKQNIKIIDDKFGAKFIKKLESADEKLDAKLAEIAGEYQQYMNGLNEKIAGYDREYLDKLTGVESDLKARNQEIIENSKIELADYTGRIETLMNEINNVRSFLNSEFTTTIEQGKDQIREFFDDEKKNTIESYKDIETAVRDVMENYRSQINKIKEGIKLIDEKLNVKIAEKLSEADATLHKSYQEINEKYNSSLQALNSKVAAIEDTFAEKIDTLEEKYTERGEKFIIDGYEKFNEIQQRIGALVVECNDLKARIDADIADKVDEGRSQLSAFFVNSKDELDQYHRALKETLTGDLNSYSADMVKIREEIKGLDEKVNVGIVQKLSQVDDRIADKFTELTGKYNEQIAGLKEKVGNIESEFRSATDRIGQEFSSKGESIYRENLERLSAFTYNFKEMEHAIDELKSRIDSEIAIKIEETLTNSYEIINEKGREIAAKYEDTANRYDTQLQELESSVADRVANAASLFKNGVADIEGRFGELKLQFSDEFTHFTDSLKQLSEEEFKKNGVAFDALHAQYTAMNSSFEKVQDELNRYGDAMRTQGAQIESEFKSLFAGFMADARDEQQAQRDENAKALHELTMNYMKLNEEMAVFKNSIDNEMSERLDSGLKNINALLAEKTDAVTAQYQVMEDEFAAKNRGYTEQLAALDRKVAGFETLFVDKLNEKVGNSDRYLSEKIDEIGGQVEHLDALYRDKVVALSEEFGILQKQLAEENGAHADELRARYDALGERMGTLDDEIRAALDEKISMGISRVETMINERIALLAEGEVQFSQNIGDRMREITEQINSLKNETAEIEAAYRRSVEDGVQAADQRIDGALAALTRRIEVVEFESSRKLDEFVNSSTEDARKYIDGVNEYVVGLQKNYESIDELVAGLRDKVEHGLPERITEGFSGLDRKVAEKSAEIDGRYAELEEHASDSIRQVIEKISYLTGQFERIDSEIESRIADKTEEEWAKVAESIAQRQELLAGSIDDAQKNADEKIAGYRDTLDHFSEEIAGINEMLNKRIDERIVHIEGAIQERVERIVHDIENLKEELNRETVLLRDSYAGKEEALYNETAGRIASFESLFAGLNGEIEHLKEDAALSLAKNADELEKSYRDRALLLEAAFAKKQEENESAYNEQIARLQQRHAESFGDMKRLLDTTVADMAQHLAGIQEELASRCLHINDEYTDKYRMLEKEFRGINEEVAGLKASLHNEFSALIDKGLADVTSVYDEKRAVMTGDWHEFESEVLARIDQYRSELYRVQDNVTGVEAKYGDLFTRKMGEFDTKLSDKFDEARNVIATNITSLNETVSGIAHEYEGKCRTLEDEFHAKSESMLLTNAKKLDEFEGKYADLADRITILKNTISDEVQVAINNGKDEIAFTLGEKIENAHKEFDAAATEVKTGIGDFKNDFVKLQQSMKQIDDRFTARFIEHSGVLDKRISAIEAEVARFEKNLSLVEKTSTMKEKLNEEIKELKSQIEEIRVDKQELQKIEKNIANIDKLAKLSEEKYSKLFNDAKKLDNINEVLSELKEMTGSVDEKIENIKHSKALISNVEEGIEKVKEKAGWIDQLIGELEKRGVIVNDSMDSIDAARNEAAALRGMISELNRSYDELAFKKDTYEKSIKEFERDASLITKSQSKVNEVMEKFREMDSFVEDIEARTSAIIKLREWLVKAETQIENLNYETDKRIKTLEALKTDIPETGKDEGRQDDSKKKMVLQLKSQGWSIDEIARTANLSIGEVEFILDLEMSNRKK